MAAGTLGCAILGTLMMIVFPAVTKLVIDGVLIQHQPERLTPLILIAALAATGTQLPADYSEQHVRAEGHF